MVGRSAKGKPPTSDLAKELQELKAQNKELQQQVKNQTTSTTTKADSSDTKERP